MPLSQFFTGDRSGHSDTGTSAAESYVRLPRRACICARWRFGGRVVAVTGSVGKTTTKEMLRCALSAFGHVHAAVASYNNHWGVPLTLAQLSQDFISGGPLM